MNEQTSEQMNEQRASLGISKLYAVTVVQTFQTYWPLHKIQIFANGSLNNQAQTVYLELQVKVFI